MRLFKTRPLRILSAAVLTAGVIAGAGLVAPVAAHATTAPTVDFSTHSRNSNSTSVTFTVSSGQANDVIVAYVSSDGPSGSAQTITVNDGTNNWTDIASASYLDGEVAYPGFAGVFSPSGAHHLAAGSYTVTASEGTHAGQVLLEVVGYSGSAGLGAAAADGILSVSSSNTYEPITSNAAGSLIYGVGHDWSQAGTPTAASGQTIDSFYSDTLNGDDNWVEYLNSATSSASQVVNMGITSPHGSSGTPDYDNIAAVEILGS